MKQMILSALIAASFFQTNAQVAIERVYIKGGSAAWENFMKEIYRYPSFEEGLVTYNNDKQYKSKLNYNKVLGVIQFIDEKGDTLALINEQDVRNVTIGKDVFFYGKACMQELKDAGRFKLVKNERVRVADNQKVGGYGIPNSTGTIESIDRDNRAIFNQLDVNETLLISKTTNFYFELAKNDIVPASKKAVFGVFPKNEDQIKEYIKEKKINFSKEDDLVALAGYLSKL